MQLIGSNDGGLGYTDPDRKPFEPGDQQATAVDPAAPHDALSNAGCGGGGHATGGSRRLAAIGIAVPLDGGVVEHGEASRSDHWRKQPVSAERRWSDQAPRDHGRHLTGDAAPVVLSVAGQSRPPVTIAAR